MKTKKIKFPFKIITIATITLVILYCSSRSFWKYISNLEYFNIKNVIANYRDIDLSYLKGKNIFNIDLKRLSAGLIAEYPSYRMIRVMRYFPNCIVVKFIRRKATAYVRLYRYFAVDEEGVLFNPEEKDLNQDLPIILGLQTKIFGAKPGERFNVKELKLALDLIKEINNRKEFRDFKIKKVDATNSVNLSFFILEDLEIKVGEDIKDKIKIFSSLLPHIHNELNKIRYIDLRFREPVIKYEK